MLTIISESLEATHALGARVGRALAVGDVLALVGPLGAGKTTLVKGIAAGAGVADARQVNSPTFVIVNEYDALRTGVRLYHIDAYRLRGAGDLEALGFDEMAAFGAVLVEWADKVPDALPPDRLTITIAPTGELGRRFELVASGPVSERLLEFARAGDAG
jgi:tRNA threonylcarbamoyladenosine biosynthesis protein TsaE